MTPRRLLDEARLALMLLTRLPAGQLDDPAPSLAQARWAFPLVGIPVAIIGWGVQAGGASMGLPPLAAAILALGAMVLATGALHHDGLADFADGIGGGRDRARRLEIMRDSRIGSYGVLALIFAIALQMASLLGFDGGAPLVAFTFIAIGSRLAMVVLIDWMPPARPDGMGSLAAGGAWNSVLPGAIALVALAPLLGLQAVVAVAAMAIAALVVALLAQRKIGGQTGDVLGAAQLSADVAGWLALAAFAA